jgi:hypothetical protein
VAVRCKQDHDMMRVSSQMESEVRSLFSSNRETQRRWQVACATPPEELWSLVQPTFPDFGVLKLRRYANWV